MMGKQLGISIVVSALVLLSSPVMAGPNMKEGKWQISSKMEMPGMPMQIPPQTFSHCLTKKDMVPRQEKPDQSCKMVKNSVKGSTVSWLMECNTPQGPSTIDGKVTYKGDSFDGLIKIRQAGMEMTQRLSGKWVGQCQ